MNAASRLVHQGTLTRHLLFALVLTKRQITLLMLALIVLISALSVIYTTHLTRVMHSAYQRALIEKDQLHVEYGQLLLERGVWLMQARTQQVAEKELGMIVPDHQSVVIVHE